MYLLLLPYPLSFFPSHHLISTSVILSTVRLCHHNNPETAIFIILHLFYRYLYHHCLLIPVSLFPMYMLSRISTAMIVHHRLNLWPRLTYPLSCISKAYDFHFFLLCTVCSDWLYFITILLSYYSALIFIIGAALIIMLLSAMILFLHVDLPHFYPLASTLLHSDTILSPPSDLYCPLWLLHLLYSIISPLCTALINWIGLDHISLSQISHHCSVFCSYGFSNLS